MKKWNKKKIIAFFGVLGLSVGLGFSINAYAEETTNQETQTVETQQEEKVTITMKLQEFQNKWMTPLVSGAIGLLGSFLGYFLYKRKYKQIMALMSSGIKMTKDERERANQDLVRAKELYEAEKADFEQKRKDYDALLQSAKEELLEMKKFREENIQFKELIGYLISSSPELAKNGYSSKILKLLDEGQKIVEIVTENVGDEDGTNN